MEVEWTFLKWPGLIKKHFKDNIVFYWGWVCGFMVGAGLVIVILGD